MTGPVVPLSPPFRRCAPGRSMEELSDEAIDPASAGEQWFEHHGSPADAIRHALPPGRTSGGRRASSGLGWRWMKFSDCHLAELGDGLPENWFITGTGTFVGIAWALLSAGKLK